MTPFDEPVLIFDGACGTSIQNMDLPDDVWEGKEGCNELLNVTAPDAITSMHAEFLDAGAHAVETNTFGAMPMVLAEYDLQDRAEEINAAAVANARRAVEACGHDAVVIGSMGPTTKLVSMGQVERDTLAENYALQSRALLEAGADALMLETCQDLLQVKTALVTCFETIEKTGRDVQVIVSVTVERTGTMLVGTDIAAVVTTLEPYPIFSLGLNCATGPEAMTSHIRYLSQNWPRRVSCIPNQGLPEVVGGKTVYPLEPEPYAAHLKRFVEELGVSVVGGCCGSTPAHIRALARAMEGVAPAEREILA